MGIFDKAKDLIGEHADRVAQGIERAGDLVDERTGGAYAGHVDRAQEAATAKVEDLRREGEQPVPPKERAPGQGVAPPPATGADAGEPR